MLVHVNPKRKENAMRLIVWMLLAMLAVNCVTLQLQRRDDSGPVVAATVEHVMELPAAAPRVEVVELERAEMPPLVVMMYVKRYYDVPEAVARCGPDHIRRGTKNINDANWLLRSRCVTRERYPLRTC
jgi:hypothetical protein